MTSEDQVMIERQALDKQGQDMTEAERDIGTALKRGYPYFLIVVAIRTQINVLAATKYMVSANKLLPWK
jgi:hypothetical protein